MYTGKCPENCVQGDHSPGKPGKVGIPKWSGKIQGKWKVREK